MIATDSEIAIVREQLARCERALASLRKELLPMHEQNFNLYARPWVDLEQELQANIDVYLATKIPSRNGVPTTSGPVDTKPLELT